MRAKKEVDADKQPETASRFTRLVDGGYALLDSVTALQAVDRMPLKQGDTGPSVKFYQEELNEWRNDNGKTGLKCDGKFDENTTAAVTDFQKAGGLLPDGLLGPQTRDRLLLENHPEFKTLDPETRNYARDAMKFSSDIPEARAGILAAAADPNLKALPKSDQAVVIDYALTSQGPDDQKKVHDYLLEAATLKSDPNFLKLDSATRMQIQQIHKDNMGNPEVSATVIQFATDPNFGKLNPAHQDAALKAFQANPSSQLPKT